MAKKKDKTDAASLLKADQAEIEDLFEQWEDADDDDREELALELVEAVRLHAAVKDEIVYPALRDAAKKPEKVEDAAALLDAIDYLAAVVEEEPDAEETAARLRVVKALLVPQMEEDGDLFRKAEGLDLDALGERIGERKAELMAEDEDEDEEDVEELDGEVPLDEMGDDDEDEDERTR